MKEWISHPMSALSLASALAAAGILIWFLLRRPTVGGRTKLVLLLGMGAFPIISAATANVVGIERSTTRQFCASCHVMEPWTNDAADPRSTSLASQHARNTWFGGEPCYSCHADYGMFRAVKAKAAGLGHVYEYVTEYHSVSRRDAVRRIRTHRPYPNANCIQCHSTRLPGFVEVQDHVGLLTDLRRGRVSCVGGGCHGPAHPFGPHEERAR